MVLVILHLMVVHLVVLQLGLSLIINATTLQVKIKNGLPDSYSYG